MKHIFQIITITIISLGVFISCIKDENLAIEATEFSSRPIQISFDGLTTFDEKNIDLDNSNTYQTTITASLIKTKSIDAIIDFNQTSGTANSDDYNIEPITIKAGKLSGETTLDIYQTGDFETSETFNLEASSRANFTVNFELPITIENDYISPLNITLSWNNIFTVDENGTQTDISTCDGEYGADFDIYLYDKDYNYTTISETYNCPESGAINDLEDGTYMVAVALYYNPLSSYNLSQILPVTLTYNQDNFIEETSFMNTGFSTDDSDEEIIVAEIEVKDGYLYTVTPL